MKKPHICVVGAGVSGLSCAARLISEGYKINIIEKSRGIGGRTAVRRTQDHGPLDLGAQFITARDPRFKKVVDHALQMGLLHEWHGKILYFHENAFRDAKKETRYVGAQGLNKWLYEWVNRDLIHFETRVLKMDSVNGGWVLTPLNDQVFDAVILSLPATQSAAILPLENPWTERFLDDTLYSPSWTLQIIFSDFLDVPFDAAFIKDEPISWVCRESSKRMRFSPSHKSLPIHANPTSQADKSGMEEIGSNKPSFDSWVIHASGPWSKIHFDESEATIADILTKNLAHILRKDLPKISHMSSHRWRFATPTWSQTQTLFWDADQKLGLCGDWVKSGRVEGAFLSGLELAESIIQTFSKQSV